MPRNIGAALHYLHVPMCAHIPCCAHLIALFILMGGGGGRPIFMNY